MTDDDPIDFQKASAARKTPPSTEEKVSTSALVEIASTSTSEGKVSTELIAIAKRNAELWRSPLGSGYATFKRDGHTEHHAVGSREFKDWIADKYGEKHQIEIDGELVPEYPKQADQKEAQYAIEAHARRGNEKQPKIRVTAFDSNLWIDLGEPEWRGVLVNADGWHIAPQLVPPLVRVKGIRALPLPQRGGRIDELREFVNLNDNDFVLFCGNVAMMYNVFGNYMTTILCGPPGSGKSTVTRLNPPSS
jgi:hypothetical protein